MGQKQTTDPTLGGRYEKMNNYLERINGAAYSNQARVDTNSKNPATRFQELGLEAQQKAARKAASRASSNSSMSKLLKIK